MVAPPSAIISYSHDSSEHETRVLTLAQRLRSDGVECEIDAYQVSPPEGWPGWMRHELETRDFCVVVCTETYERRFVGNEVPGTGKGAAWEGRLLRQMLYEAGKNDRVIPVVFRREDVQHIPLELKDATYYDLSTDNGYDRLHRALTRQPLVERSAVGPVRKHLPLLLPQERGVMALIGRCPSPLPIEVIGRCVPVPVALIDATLGRLTEKGFVSSDGGRVSLPDRSIGGLPALSAADAGLALEATLDFIEQNHGNAAGRAQVPNAVALVHAADAHVSAHALSRAFSVLHQLLKARGDKRLVLEIARRSIEAARVPGRGPEQAKDEAVAEICGVSWVYQRVGRLDQARLAAEHSLELGGAISWDRNTAFCKKCLGRLHRMQAELLAPGGGRAELLEQSERLLLEAIERFTELGVEAEVGDCYSLLARTRLVAGDVREARDATQEAEERLVEHGSKDYLDLQIVQGDLMAHSNRRSAEAIYSDVLAQITNEDAQKSEIFARAYLHRGRVRAALRATDNAMADFRRAAQIWDTLEDPNADLAHWEIERNAEWLDRDALQLIGSEPLAVRVRVARMVRERVAVRPVPRARRAKLPERYLRDLIREARERLAIERPEW